jgi:serine phosphatase RsbU (regulator of sigma subunit)
MFTDGATEIFDARDNQLDQEGFVRLIHEEMGGNTDGNLDLEKLAEKLLAFSDQIHLADDLTLLKLRRTG